MPNLGVLIGGRVLARSPAVMRDKFVVTRAQLNAGRVLISGAPSARYEVLNARVKVNGAFNTSTGGTSALLQTTAATPVVVSTILKAALTAAAEVLDSDVGFGAGAGFRATLARGSGIKAITGGTAFDAGTSVEYDITYRLVEHAKIA